MKRIFLLSLITSIVFVSCQSTQVPEFINDDSTAVLSQTIEELIYSELPPAIIGEKLPNPMELTNVKKAFLLLDEKTRAGFSPLASIILSYHYATIKTLSAS